ncbi:unnamed protein product [Peronospora destructor]|uniref:ABC transporter domain-containing protein n=2 Tax=Peronospora destructor TaxID=86335 RepID=A0AAV0U300_9STRA|nr:unnamed protein product [Peronospora destructor]
MPSSRRNSRNRKQNPRRSRKSMSAPSMDFRTSISSMSSEPMPILEPPLTSSYQKHVLRHHQHRDSRRHATSARGPSGQRNSPFTPRRPAGAVPELFVTFRHVSLAVDTPVSHAAAIAATQAASGQMSRETLAAKQLPTITNHVRGIFGALSANKTFVRRQILKNVTGAFTPGSMTLLLGRSGSGKSVLLKLLSGRFDVNGKGVTLNGEVSYNGLSRDELKLQLPQCVAYVPQQDTHLSVMTVKETLDFAFECCAINADAKLVSAVYKSSASEHPRVLPTTYLDGERDPITVARELGLTRCQGTILGDERIRGVSGGERKRVTTGEMAFGPHAMSLMDEITTGLDSSAAFDVTNAQRRLARQQRKTVVISLQQPAPEVLALFDNILLLAEGEVLYHGPRTQIQAYFEALGFVCPPECDLADFLCNLASSQQVPYEILHAPMPGRRRHPRSANEFADLWIMSPMYEAMVEELDCLDNSTEVHSQIPNKNGEKRICIEQEALLRVPAFRQNYLRSTWTVVKRQVRLFARNKVYFIGRLLLDILVGLMVGSIYYGMDLADPQVTLGVIFSCALFLGLGQSATLAPFFDALLVFVGEYFFLAAACSTLHVAQPVSTLILLFFILFAGFAVSREQLSPAMRWIYWSNPLAWSIRGILVNQYRSSELDVCEYGGINYCKMYQGQTMGERSLGLYDVPDDPKWVMLGIVYLAMVYVASMFLSCLMLEYCRHESTIALLLPAIDTIPTSRLQNESYVMLSTPHGDEAELLENDEAIFQLPGNGDNHVVLGEDDGLNESSHASQGIQTNPEHFMLDKLELKDSGCPVAEDFPINMGKSKQTLTRELLKGVTGYALPGTMTALMGSTGAGKTTLMDVLAGRKSRKAGNNNDTDGAPTSRGRVLLNGVDATELAVRRCTGYCEQMDVHSDAATFREALQFSAYLRQGDWVAPERVEEIVDECLDLLGLNDVAGQLVRGSSNEQLKRLTLGVELAAQPSVLFLDEPTSGLDARAAKSLMDGVRKVADTGRTIICTIHQPSTEVLLLFDSLLLLQRGGEVVYFGALGHNGESLVNYFQDLGLPRSAPQFKSGDNPATWMLDVIGAGIEKYKPMSSPVWKLKRAAPIAKTLRYSRHHQLDGSPNSSVSSEFSRQRHNECVDFVAAYKSSHIKQCLDAKRAVPGVFMPSDRLPSVTFAHRRAASNGLQFAMLMRRFIRLYWRTPLYTFTRMMTALTLGLMFGLVYSGNNDVTTYQAYVQVLPLAFEERGSFYRERACETYSVLWYFAASSIVEIPYAAVTSMIFVSAFYPMAGFSAFGGFTQVVIYWLVLTVHIMFQTYFGQFFTFTMPSIELAAVWGGLFDSIFLMFMGYNPPMSSIPDGYKWLSQLVPHHYTFGMLTALILGDCPDEQLRQIVEAAASNITIDVSSWPLGCQPLTDAPPAVANIPLISYIDEVFGARREDTTCSVVIVMAILLVMRLATLIVMRFVNHQKR